MKRNLADIIEGRQPFTPDEWPAIRRHLDALGIGPVRRVRMALSNPEAGWKPVTNDAETTQRASVGVDVFEGLP
jgi:hypothetical protein